LVCQENQLIYGVESSKGKNHDFKIFKNKKRKIPSTVKIIADSGYQGIKKIHSNSRIPIKKPKGKELTKRQKLYNHLLSKKRIIVENVIRRCKIFRITKSHKNHNKIWNLVAGLVNFRYQNACI